MNIIHDQATTTYTVEAHTIDTNVGQGLDMVTNPDLLLNPTLTAGDIRTSRDLDDGWRVFRGLVGTGQFTPGSGKRLVLKAADQ